MLEINSFTDLLAENNYPKLILFDAVGTLFGVKDSVGDIYCKIAKKYGVNSSAELINYHFYQAFKNATPCVFPSIALEEIPNYEYQWWLNINQVTFSNAGLIDRFTDFAAFFNELYTYFTTANAWSLYPDVMPTLTQWQALGISLGILSKFDSRLYQVLDNLSLTHYFDSITISTIAGSAKPDPQVFNIALAKYNFTPQEVWHIGDSWDDDIIGAKLVNITPVWIKRN